MDEGVRRKGYSISSDLILDTLADFHRRNSVFMAGGKVATTPLRSMSAEHSSSIAQMFTCSCSRPV
jgi:hypothetical protein